MRKFGFAAVLAAASMAAPAFAQTNDSEAFQIQGTVPVECVIINNSVAAVEVVNLDGTEQTLGSFTYRCNLRSGFSRTISSANSGNMVDGAGGDISYNFAHGGGSGLDKAP